MNPVAWLASLVMPACGFPGAQGLPPPVLLDTAAIVRPASPNTVLAGPEGFRPVPDVVTPGYKVPPDRLFALAQEVAAGQARTYPAAAFPERLQAHWVVRSAVFNFPDLVTVEVRASGVGSDLVLYSRSVYGESDLGANRKRADAWLAALAAKLPPPNGK
jgi:hypothetical protein